MSNSSIFSDINFEDILTILSTERPVFHSEADFQFALAWKIKSHYPEVNVRLEKKVKIENELIYLDILLNDEFEEFAIELKYKTKATEEFKHNNDIYKLTNHGAHGNGRYDYFKDISRIERFNGNGVAIFLTNDHLYWNQKGKGPATPDDNFRIHQGVTINGHYDWLLRDQYTDEQFVKSYTKQRLNAINIAGNYAINWVDYSNIDGIAFRYLIMDITTKAE